MTRDELRAVATTLAFVAAAVVGVSPAGAQVGKLFPVDEAANDPEFFSFRAQLLQAVLRKDTTALYAVLAPNILSSFGGDGGIAEFKSMWRAGDSDSELWHTLAEVLSLGGTFYSDTLFSAPYTFSRFPPEFDAFDHLVVTGATVRVRAAPDVSSEVLATSSFDILPIAHEVSRRDLSPGWEAVRLTDGRNGFVDGRYIRSPIAYRATFVRRGGRWLIRSLVAGD